MDQKQTILIVDDDEGTRKSLTLIFDKAGYETETVGTGREGLERARERFFNVAILDIRLPDIEGVDLITPLKEIHPDMAIIIVTAYASIGTSVRALNEGASAYMNKPLALDQVLATVRDTLEKQRVVDEKRRVEQALRESEEKYRDLVENINDVIYTIDGNGVLTYINPAVELCLGYSPSELEGQSFAPFLHEEDAQRAMDGFVSLLSGRPTTGEYRVLAKSGEFRWMHTSNRPVLEGDRVIGATGMMTDITDRREMEQALQESESRWRSLVDNAPNMIFNVRRDGTIQYMNHTVPGLTLEQVIGTSIYEYIPPENHEALRKVIEQVFQIGEVISYEIAGTGPHGSTSWYTTQVGPVKRSDEIISATLITTDITERKEAEEALRSSREKLRIAFECMADGIAVTDASGNITELNEALVRLHGYSCREEIVGRNATELIAEKDKSRVAENLGEVLTGGHTHTGEYKLLAQDGGEVECEVTASRLIDAAGNPAGVVAVVRDITERKQAEAALLASEEKLRTIFETMTDAIAVVDVSGNVVEVNEATVRLHGYSRKEELIGKNALDLIAEKDRAKAIEGIRNVAAGGSALLMQYSLLTNDGTIVEVEVGATVLCDGLRNPVGVVAVMRDITERKRMEAALQRSEAKFKQIFNSVREEIALVDTNGKIIELNERSRDLFGYPPEEVVGHNFADLDFVIGPEGVSGLAALFMQAMSGEKHSKSFVEFDAKHGIDGHIIPVEVSIGPLEGANGEIEGFLAVLRDVSERKRAEEELARVRKEKDAQLIQSAKLANLGEMATGIAHEINQPLNIIKLTCSGLDRSMRRGKTITPEILTEELQSIDSQIERMRSIINHMRTFARRSSEVKSEYTDMNIPLRECFKFVGEQLRLREIEVQLELEELPTVMADSNKIEQVFLNIIGNARDAMDNFAASAGPDYKKLLKVRSFTKNGNAVVIFTDTGGGIPQSIRDRIFEPFFTTKEVGKGTGLGLSISYSILKEIDGTLGFSVEDGVGTTFRVTVPVASARRKFKGGSSPSSS